MTIFSRKSDSTFNNVCPFICPSVHLSSKPLNSLKSSSFSHPSSFFIHLSFILRLVSFSVAKATLQSQMLSVCHKAKPINSLKSSSSSSIFHPSSFFIHTLSFCIHPSSFFIHPSFILRLLSFSACSLARADVENISDYSS